MFYLGYEGVLLRKGSVVVFLLASKLTDEVVNAGFQRGVLDRGKGNMIVLEYEGVLVRYDNVVFFLLATQLAHKVANAGFQ